MHRCWLEIAEDAGRLVTKHPSSSNMHDRCQESMHCRPRRPTCASIMGLFGGLCNLQPCIAGQAIIACLDTLAPPAGTSQFSSSMHCSRENAIHCPQCQPYVLQVLLGARSQQTAVLNWQPRQAYAPCGCMSHWHMACCHHPHYHQHAAPKR